MRSANIAEADLRFGAWGPGHLLDSPAAQFGTLLLRPGDEFENHYHAKHEETFVVLRGSVTIWMNCRDRYELSSGSLHACDAGEMHYLVNNSADVLELLFVKSPCVPGDKFAVPWRPGDPTPML